MQLLILGLVQGLVEFLPVSSSGHLVLLPVLMGWDDQGLAYDIAAHLGTLVAVAGYYRRDLLLMSVDMLHQLRGGPVTPLARLGWAVTFGTIPVGLAGLLAHDFVAVNLRSTLVIAASTAGFGLLLWFADRRGARSRDEHSLNWRDILIIGGAQALAMIPGTSRSGITITAGLLCGLTRQAAARYSFLLSVPVIFLAGSFEAVAVIRSGVQVSWFGLWFVTFVSFISAYVCIHFFLKLIDKIGMAPFAIYRLCLAALLVGIWLL
jgi:undecaprenyl-diphosphatase